MANVLRDIYITVHFKRKETHLHLIASKEAVNQILFRSASKYIHFSKRSLFPEWNLSRAPNTSAVS